MGRLTQMIDFINRKTLPQKIDRDSIYPKINDSEGKELRKKYRKKSKKMKKPIMNVVTSSQINAIGYDNETNTLFVEFSSGKTYLYKEVPERIFNNMSIASSPGSYFNTMVRGKYEYETVE